MPTDTVSEVIEMTLDTFEMSFGADAAKMIVDRSTAADRQRGYLDALQPPPMTPLDWAIAKKGGDTPIPLKRYRIRLPLWLHLNGGW